MITTKYNFKQRMSKKYPQIIFTPVYGTSAYLFNKELDPIDMYEYNVQQLANGQYICFVGSNDPDTIAETIKQFNSGQIPLTRRETPYAPTTFTTFEAYLQRHAITATHRTHVQEQSANEALFQNNEDPLWGVRRNWYMYEFDKSVPIVFNPQTPVLETDNSKVVLIKASNSSYISKKKLFMQRFTRMQPLYDQLIAACATEDWERAELLCEQYVSIQFDQTLILKDREAMKEAYANGLLRLYTRNIKNFEVAITDETL